MIREHRRSRSRLLQERRALQKRLERVDRDLQMLDGRGGRGRGRARNQVSLPAAMETVLKKSGKPMRVGDIVDAVQRSGYRSSSANFRGIVNQTLIKEPRFKSTERGFYTLK